MADKKKALYLHVYIFNLSVTFLCVSMNIFCLAENHKLALEVAAGRRNLLGIWRTKVEERINFGDQHLLPHKKEKRQERCRAIPKPYTESIHTAQAHSLLIHDKEDINRSS